MNVNEIKFLDTIKNINGDVEEQQKFVVMALGAILGTRFQLPTVKSGTASEYFSSNFRMSVTECISRVNEVFVLDCCAAYDLASSIYIARYNSAFAGLDVLLANNSIPEHVREWAGRNYNALISFRMLLCEFLGIEESEC